MNISNTPALRDYIRELWKKFLLTGMAGELLLGEVADHLYIENIPRDIRRRSIPKYAHDPVVSYAVVTGFYDTVQDAVEQMIAEPKRTQPYSELLTGGDFYDREWLGKWLLGRLFASVRRYSASEIQKNPYYRHIPLADGTSGRIRLTSADTIPYEFFQTFHETYDPRDPFVYGTAGFFDETVRFPVLLEGDQVWMSIVLSEIRSMAGDIERARGRVITYGLGLGYFAYMAAEKEDVESVTAIELNPDVIRLFKRHILPHFSHPEKVRIIEGDAYEFLQSQKDGDYDFAYADFWAGVADGTELYLRFLPMAARFRRTRFSYWIETCFIDYVFRPAMMQILMQEGLGRKVILPENGAEAASVQYAFADFLKRKDIAVRTKEDVDALLTPETLTALVHEFAVTRA